MSIQDPTDDVEVVTLALPLDRATIDWLSRMSRGNNQSAAEMIAFMLSAIREDDDAAHRTMH